MQQKFLVLSSIVGMCDGYCSFESFPKLHSILRHIWAKQREIPNSLKAIFDNESVTNDKIFELISAAFFFIKVAY